jgi:uncharacterized protein YndB with AHSA1/START domain
MSKNPRAGTLELTRELAAPPERVFQALTTPEQLARWWQGHGGISRAQFDLRPGGAYRLEFTMGEGKIAVVHGVVHEVNPPRRLVMTWFSPDDPDMETLLSFDLEPLARGTRLKLRHTGFTTPKALDDHEQGWIEALGLLLAWIASGGPAMLGLGRSGDR